MLRVCVRTSDRGGNTETSDWRVASLLLQYPMQYNLVRSPKRESRIRLLPRVGSIYDAAFSVDFPSVSQPVAVGRTPHEIAYVNANLVVYGKIAMRSRYITIWFRSQKFAGQLGHANQAFPGFPWTINHAKLKNGR